MSQLYHPNYLETGAIDNKLLHVQPVSYIILKLHAENNEKLVVLNGIRIRISGYLDRRHNIFSRRLNARFGGQCLSGRTHPSLCQNNMKLLFHT